ncbi:hypothetical protein FA95DRAFT_1610219 [Auriscalpium vulgare]|uniref:Uncharacterized protein n=1 Tax=Auriscalpium vulgare TaxID=40419 RepID=A0ACB8REV6_9AGAM|nr:hypothetical protein FA95DRAFT_1610219 [Auriscalpium vulgare]
MALSLDTTPVRLNGAQLEMYPVLYLVNGPHPLRPSYVPEGRTFIFCEEDTLGSDGNATSLQPYDIIFIRANGAPVDGSEDQLELIVHPPDAKMDIQAPLLTTDAHDEPTPNASEYQFASMDPSVTFPTSGIDIAEFPRLGGEDGHARWPLAVVD